LTTRKEEENMENRPTPILAVDHLAIDILHILAEIAEERFTAPGSNDDWIDKCSGFLEAKEGFDTATKSLVEVWKKIKEKGVPLSAIHFVIKRLENLEKQKERGWLLTKLSLKDTINTLKSIK